MTAWTEPASKLRLTFFNTLILRFGALQTSGGQVHFARSAVMWDVENSLPAVRRHTHKNSRGLTNGCQKDMRSIFLNIFHLWVVGKFFNLQDGWSAVWPISEVHLRSARIFRNNLSNVSMHLPAQRSSNQRCCQP